MKNFTFSTLLLLVLSVTFFSCANKKKQKEELDVKKSEIATIVSDYVYPLPSSFELMDMLNAIDAAYIIGITNEAEKASTYENKDKQALNLGVYLSDFSYASIYNRKQSAQEFLGACELLVRDMHVDDSFPTGFVTQVSDQVENRDSVVSFITKATQHVYGDFHRKGHKDLAYLMVAGSWTEAMYLTLIVADNTPLNAQIVNTIVFQHKPLVATIALLQEVENNVTISAILAALQGINETFNTEDAGSLTMDQVEQLTAQTNALRALIIE